jgi:hypothetical protein
VVQNPNDYRNDSGDRPPGRVKPRSAVGNDGRLRHDPKPKSAGSTADVSDHTVAQSACTPSSSTFSVTPQIARPELYGGTNIYPMSHGMWTAPSVAEH